MLYRSLLLFLISLTFYTCKKDPVFTNDPSIKLSFSRDTILFDTVFTSVGSTTQRLKIYNPSKKSIRIANIKLAGSPKSSYQLNVNGIAANELSNFELAPQDSVNLFVKVTLDQTAAKQSFIVQDSILFLTNGNRQTVHLRTYGQNAQFINNKPLIGNVTWTNNLPIVIYNTVTVEKDATLTIEAGTKLYFHKDARLVVAGTLEVNGNVNEPVTFMSDRLERIYENEPGQWRGIVLSKESRNNKINHAIIKNALIGLQVDSLSQGSNSPKLLLGNTLIKNMEIAAILATKSDLKLFNNLFYNCGQYLIYAVNGGTYDLKQNTFAAYNFNFPRQTPALYFSDYSAKKTFPLDISLYNNIIWGSLNEEFIVSKKGTSVTLKAYTNVIKTKDVSLSENGNLLNRDPLFQNPSLENFQLLTGSVAINKGIDLTSDPYFASYLAKDIKQKQRIFPSALGSYQVF